MYEIQLTILALISGFLLGWVMKPSKSIDKTKTFGGE